MMLYPNDIWVICFDDKLDKILKHGVFIVVAVYDGIGGVIIVWWVFKFVKRCVLLAWIWFVHKDMFLYICIDGGEAYDTDGDDGIVRVEERIHLVRVGLRCRRIVFGRVPCWSDGWHEWTMRCQWYRYFVVIGTVLKIARHPRTWWQMVIDQPRCFRFKHRFIQSSIFESCNTFRGRSIWWHCKYVDDLGMMLNIPKKTFEYVVNFVFLGLESGQDNAGGTRDVY